MIFHLLWPYCVTEQKLFPDLGRCQSKLKNKGKRGGFCLQQQLQSFNLMSRHIIEQMYLERLVHVLNYSFHWTLKWVVTVHEGATKKQAWPQGTVCHPRAKGSCCQEIVNQLKKQASDQCPKQEVMYCPQPTLSTPLWPGYPQHKWVTSLCPHTHTVYNCLPNWSSAKVWIFVFRVLVSQILKLFPFWKTQSIDTTITFTSS